MKNLKRVLALVGILFLAGMYILSFIFALTDSSAAGNMLMASLYATVIIPVLFYAIALVYKWTHSSSLEKPAVPAKREHTETSGKTEKPEAHTKEIDTVILDIGNVLVRYDWERLLQNLGYDEQTKAAVASAVFLSPDWQEADRGVKSEEEILASFIENNPAYEPQIRETFASMGKTITQFSFTKGWLESLKAQGYKLYILSNFSKPLYERCKEEMQFLNLVDGGYMSWQTHLLKPDPHFYKKLLEDFHIAPAHAVYVDDMLENVAEARRLGMKGVHFTGRKKAVQELEKFGVK